MPIHLHDTIYYPKYQLMFTFYVIGTIIAQVHNFSLILQNYTISPNYLLNKSIWLTLLVSHQTNALSIFSSTTRKNLFTTTSHPYKIFH